ncbi:MAG: HD-GYP domain-containing protein [Bacillota bacterium]
MPSTFKRFSKYKIKFENLIKKDKTKYEIIKEFIKILDKKDNYTLSHCKRVKKYSIQLAKRLNLSNEEIENIRCGSLIHDIGKLFIKNEILNKPDKLTIKEYENIKKHPIFGYYFLDNINGFEDIKEIVLDHHERVDGKGYPFKKSSNDIHYLAKIISIADAYDAMTSKRPYRKNPFTHKKAKHKLKSSIGFQFEKDLVYEFIKSID